MDKIIIAYAVFLLFCILLVWAGEDHNWRGDNE